VAAVLVTGNVAIYDTCQTVGVNARLLIPQVAMGSKLDPEEVISRSWSPTVGRTGVPLGQENALPYDPTVGLCLGS